MVSISASASVWKKSGRARSWLRNMRVCPCREDWTKSRKRCAQNRALLQVRSASASRMVCKISGFVAVVEALRVDEILQLPISMQQRRVRAAHARTSPAATRMRAVLTAAESRNVSAASTWAPSRVRR